jgi:MarR family transcriptional regulator, organic hydroperoxide resistance regulator
MKSARAGAPDLESLPALSGVLGLMRLVWEVDQKLQRISSRMEGALGVTGLERFVIRIVGKFPGIPAGHLARLVHVYPSTLSGVLHRLEQRDLIRRRADVRDGRRALLGLTDRGHLLDVDTDGTVEAAVRRVFETTAPARLAAARQVLASLAMALDVTPE